MSQDKSGPAFLGYESTGYKSQDSYKPINGMTLRQWYAGMALWKINGESFSDPKNVAERCFAIADAMLSEGKDDTGRLEAR